MSRELIIYTLNKQANKTSSVLWRHSRGLWGAGGGGVGADDADSARAVGARLSEGEILDLNLNSEKGQPGEELEGSWRQREGTARAEVGGLGREPERRDPGVGRQGPPRQGKGLSCFQ